MNKLVLVDSLRGIIARAVLEKMPSAREVGRVTQDQIKFCLETGLKDLRKKNLELGISMAKKDRLAGEIYKLERAVEILPIQLHKVVADFLEEKGYESQGFVSFGTKGYQSDYSCVEVCINGISHSNPDNLVITIAVTSKKTADDGEYFSVEVDEL